jgi:hypothetical protein
LSNGSPDIVNPVVLRIGHRKFPPYIANDHRRLWCIGCFLTYSLVPIPKNLPRSIVNTGVLWYTAPFNVIQLRLRKRYHILRQQPQPHLPKPAVYIKALRTLDPFADVMNVYGSSFNTEITSPAALLSAPAPWEGSNFPHLCTYIAQMQVKDARQGLS